MIWTAFFEWNEPWHDNPEKFSRWHVKLANRAPLGETGYLFEASKPGYTIGNLTEEEDLSVVMALIKLYVRTNATEMPTRELLA